MRQKQVTGGGKEIQRTQRKEPLNEGIQKKAPRSRGFFKKMSDDELVSYAKKIIEENGIKNRKGLERADSGLRKVLMKRNLLDAVIPEKHYRNLASMSNEDLISFSRKFIEENAIKSRNSLEKADGWLCYVLRKRELLDQLIPNKRGRNWSSMASEELISYARKIIEKNGIENRKDLQKADGGLYNALIKRKLLSMVIPEKQYRDWHSVLEDELISLAKDFIKENEIKSRTSLKEADSGLYRILSIRKLLSLVVPERQLRDWSSMSNDEIFSYTKKFIKANKIENRRDLQKADSNLYQILIKRNLLDSIISRKIRNWSSMSDKELIFYAKTFIRENAIKNRKGLEKADAGLYDVLRRRKLLDSVFSDIEQTKKKEAVKQVVDAMKEFGGSE